MVKRDTPCHPHLALTHLALRPMTLTIILHQVQQQAAAVVVQQQPWSRPAVHCRAVTPGQPPGPARHLQHQHWPRLQPPAALRRLGWAF